MAKVGILRMGLKEVNKQTKSNVNSRLPFTKSGREKKIK